MDNILLPLIAYSLAEFVLVTNTLREWKLELRPIAFLTHAVLVSISIMIGVALDRGPSDLFLSAVVALGFGGLYWTLDILFTLALLRYPRVKKAGDLLLGKVDSGLYIAVLFVVRQVLLIAGLILILGLAWQPMYPVSNMYWFTKAALVGELKVVHNEAAAVIILVVILGTFGVSELLRLTLGNAFSSERSVIDRYATSLENRLSILKSQQNVAVGLDVAVSRKTSKMWYPFKGWLNLPPDPAEQPNLPQEEAHPLGTGRWIGMAERIVMMLMVVLNAWQGIPFILTAKSLARAKELENNRSLAEYFLVGTLLSSVFGVLMGMIVSGITHH